VPGVGGTAQLESLTDVDWWTVSATAADIGKRFHVVTQPGRRIITRKNQRKSKVAWMT
jgi:hypothetical protein